MRAPTSSTKREIAIVFICVLVAIFFSAYCIGCKSFWLDETSSAMGIGSRLQPVYYSLLSWWQKLGSSDGFLRTLSLVAAVATVPVVYLVGRRLAGPAAGAAAAVLFSLHPMVIQYAQEARGYALVMFLVTLSTLFLLLAVDTGRTIWWVGFGVAGGLAVFTHLFAIAVLIGHFLTFAVTRFRRLLQWRGVVVSALLFFVAAPVIVVPLLRDGFAYLDWIPRPNQRDFITSSIDLAANYAYPVYVLLGSLWVFHIVRSRRWDPESLFPFVLVALWALGPIVESWVISQWRPIFLSRYLIVSLPAAVLLAAVGFAVTKPRWIALVALVGAGFLSVQGIRHYYEVPKPNWRAAVGVVDEDSSERSGVLIHASYESIPYLYYAERVDSPHEVISPTTDGGYPSVAALVDALHDGSVAYDSLWLVLRSPYADPAQVDDLRDAVDEDYRLLDSTEVPGGVELLHYVRER